MALDATRLALIKTVWSQDVKQVLRAYLIRSGRHKRWGPFPGQITHTADLYDDEERTLNNLDGYAEVPFLEHDEDDQIGTDENGNPIYAVRKMRGPTWRGFAAALDLAEANGLITSARATRVRAFFRAIRVLKIQSMDARTAEHPDRYGWAITLQLRSRSDTLRYRKTVEIWASRPDADDDDVDDMSPEE